MNSRYGFLRSGGCQVDKVKFLCQNKWKSKLDDFAELANGKWFNDGRPELGTVGVFSKFYCLDMNDVKTVDDLYPNGFFL